MKKKLLTIVVGASVQGLSAQEGAPRFQLNPLPYAAHALEPYIGRQTVELHHGKHLQTYVNNVNSLVVGTKYEGMCLEEMARKAEGALGNNVGQVVNHDLYFGALSPHGGGNPPAALADALSRQWGSVEQFKTEFERQATSLFGSGWTYLVKSADGKLSIRNYANGETPLRDDLTPLLGFDVWEHAYYLDYQNRRADYLKALWNIVDWNVVLQRYER